MSRKLFKTALTVLTGIALTASAQEAGKPAPPFELTDINGKTQTLAEYKGKIVVLEWTNFGCPFVLKHYESDNMQALQREYTAKGVVWLTLCSSAPGKQGNLEPAQWQEKLTQYKAAVSAMLPDPDGTVGKSYGAKTTPHMFVISADGIVLYNGAIDNQPGTNREIIKEAVNYVRRALDATLAGESVETATTVPYGCSVKY